jgi:LacI family transcriptional regulator
MPPNRTWTIRQVAEAAGVSTQTVSRVLNNRPDVARDTFDRVQKVIAETGYAPNLLARGLTQGRSNTIGVVAYGLDYFGPSSVITGIEREAADRGYSISLNLLHEPETDAVDGLLNSLRARQVDGIIWAIPDIGDNRSWFRSHSPQLAIPVVLVGGMGGQGSLPSIGIENAMIGRLATAHLLAGGASTIGIVTGPSTWWEAQQREEGWRETLRWHGHEADASLIGVGDWTANSGEQAVYALLEARPDIDAIYASNDQMALGALHAAHRLGRRVPEDLAVVGTDDIAEASHFWPALTTVRQPLLDAGASAVKVLDETIRDHGATGRTDEVELPTTMRLIPELIVRQSTRPVAV